MFSFVKASLPILFLICFTNAFHQTIPASEGFTDMIFPISFLGTNSTNKSNGKPSINDRKPSNAMSSVETGKYNDDGGQLLGPAIGTVLLILGIVVAIVNEKSYCNEAKGLRQELKVCKTVNNQEGECEGKLVHLTGNLSTKEALHDDYFGVKIHDALKLRRKVEVLQWKEDATFSFVAEEGFKYTKVWCEELIESGNFFDKSHFNDIQDFFKVTETLSVSNVMISDYSVPQRLIDKLSNWQALKIGENLLNNIPPLTLNELTKSGRYLFLKNGNFFISKNKNPKSEHEPGDMKISYYRIPCVECSLVSCQEKNSFVPFSVPAATTHIAEHNRVLKDDSLSGVFHSIFKRIQPPLEEIEWLFEGKKNKHQFFNEILNERKSFRNFMRFISWVLLLVGIFTLFGPIYYVSSYLPMVGGMVGLITKVVGVFIALIFASAIFFLIIAIIWLFYLPIVSAIFVLLATALLLFYFLI